MTQFDDDDSTYDDRDDPQDADMDADERVESVDTIPCPYCGAPVYEHAERCATCGRYVSQESAPPARKPAWIWIAAILCIIAILIVWLHG